MCLYYTPHKGVCVLCCAQKNPKNPKKQKVLRGLKGFKHASKTKWDQT